jgi:MFS family permease
LIAFLGTVFFLPESLPLASRKPLRQIVIDGEIAAPSASLLDSLRARPVLLGLMAASLLVGVAGAAMQSVFQFWGRDLFDYSLRDVGLHFAAFALLSAVGQAALIGPLAKRFGEKHVAVGSIIGVTIGLGLFAVAQSDAMVWIAISIFGIANGLFLPSISSLVSFETDAGSRGAVMGVFNASSSAGRILGPAISGPLYFKVGPAAPFIFSAATTALGALMLSRARARKSDEAT